MFITIGSYCYNTDQVICFGIDTDRKEDFIAVELTNGTVDEVEFDSHEKALENFHHALKQLALMTCKQAKKNASSEEGLKTFQTRYEGGNK